MKLAFHCAKCGKLLGFYEGEDFIFVWEGLKYTVKVFCRECDPLKEKVKK